jgi:hypothetical protein
VHRINSLNVRPDVAAYCVPQIELKQKYKPEKVTFNFLRRFLVKVSPPALVSTVPPPSSRAITYARSASDLVIGMSNVEELIVEELRGIHDRSLSARSICYGGRGLKDLEYIMQTVIGTGWATRHYGV